LDCNTLGSKGLGNNSNKLVKKRVKLKSLAASNKKNRVMESSISNWVKSIPYSETLMGIITFSSSGSILTMDSEICAFLKYGKKKLIGSAIQAICVDVNQLDAILNALKKKELVKGELLIEKKNGTRIVARVKASKILVSEDDYSVQLQCVLPVVETKTEKVVRRDFDVLFEALPDSVFIHDFQVITHVNQAFLDLYGYDSKEEIIGQPIPAALVHPDDFSLILEGRRKAVGKESIRIPNLKTIKKDGTVFLSESRLSSIQFNGTPHLLVASRDITNRKQREEQITEANLLMKESQKLAQLGSWQWDVASNKVTWSNELYLIYGLTQGTFKASFAGYLERVHPEDREYVKETVQKALQDKEPIHFEERIVRPNGEVRHLRSWGQVKTDRQGNPVKMLGACLDITEQKRSETEFNEKEYQLRQLTESVQSAIIVADSKARIRYWNNHAVKVFGYSKEEAVKLRISDLMPKKYVKRHEEAMMRFAGNKTIDWKGKRLELEGLHKDGKAFPIELSLTSWNQGNTSFACAIISDITKRREDQKELAASVQKFRTLFETSLDGIYKSTPEGKFIEVNPALVKMLGYDSEQELMEIDIKSQLYFSQDERDVKEEDGVEVYRLKKKDGSEIWAEDHGRYEYDSQGKLLFHNGIIRDVTKRKTAEDNLLHTLNITMEQNKRLMDFSYIVSHNLRSHSSNISGILSILELTEKEEERQRLMDMLKKVTDALDDTMYHLNNVVSIQTNKDIPSEQLNLSDYINKTKEILGEQIHSKKALVTNKVSKDVMVNYNAAYLESILLNFMSNSLKYASPSRRPKIVFSCKEEQGDLRLLICDNGIGIDLEKYGDSLFGMYKTFHGNKDARGIGLFISKNQVGSMGGSIEVESTPGKGSCFTIVFRPEPLIHRG